MFILRGKYVQHIYLILILMQVIGFKTVQGIVCVQCGVSGVEECKSDPSTFETCKDLNITNCFTQIDNTSGKVVRGCLSDASKCTPEANCVISDSTKNNQLVCKTCSANETDCSHTDVLANKYSKICEADLSKCITKLDGKFVVRGCATEAESTQCTDKNICATCTGVNCNTDIMPPNRLSCYQCSGDKCNDVTANSIPEKQCELFQDKDECYTKGESETTMTRGCKSDANENKCSAAAEGCAFCAENGCNKLKYKNQPTLKCYQCEGDSQNRTCFAAQTEANLKTCTQEFIYNQAQYCYTHIQDEKIERGCLNDNANLTAENCNDAEGGVCSKCTGDGCNIKDAGFTCIRCRSDENRDCWNDATKIKGEKCRIASSPSNGCYHGIWSGVAIRGCMLDASPQDQALCKEANNPNKCKICNAKDCNIEKSAGAKIGLSITLMAAVLARLTLWK